MAIIKDFSGVGPGTDPSTTKLPWTVDDLRSTHITYDKYQDEWTFLQAAYDGARALVAYGAILRHERESNNNFDRRTDEAYGFSYSTSVIDLFNFYLFKESAKRQLDKLADDESWGMFDDDCNLRKDSFDDFLLAAGKASSIQGHCGILVDKPRVNLGTKGSEKAKGVYPYISLYKPLAILDWEYGRDDYNRPRLTYLKVKDDEDNLYRLWYLDRWEVWEEPDTDEGGGVVTGTSPARKLDEGTHSLGEIPFVWLYNVKTTERGYGRSDIVDIARIDASIMRNLSQGEEIINYGAFPMMRKPWKPTGQTTPDEVGMTAVLGFDPEFPESKPDWLEAKVLEPINAIFTIVITKKVEEIYRSANIGGMAGTEIQTAPKSGTALRSEFQLLNGKLVAKGKALEKAEKEIIRLWLKWQKQDSLYDKIVIERADTYEIDNLTQDLENILTSTLIVQNDEFKRRIQKKVIRLMFTGEPDEVIQEMEDAVDEDIDNPVEPEGPVYALPPEGEPIPGEPLPGQPVGQPVVPAGKTIPFPGKGEK